MHPIFEGIWTIIMTWPYHVAGAVLILITTWAILRQAHKASEQVTAELEQGQTSPISCAAWLGWILVAVFMMGFILFAAAKTIDPW